MIEICFVCTGNTCRSVMAERIAKKMAKEKGMKQLKFSSAGINARKENITPFAKQTLKALGYDSRDRKSVKLKVKPNCIYVAVTKDHKKFVNAEKTLCFDDLYCAVSDPYGKDAETYLQAGKLIEKNVEVLLQKIQNLRGEK